MLAAINAIAWSQHGVFSTAQAMDAGVSSNWLARHVAQGTIEHRAHGIYALACAPRTPRQDLMVHVLAAGPGAFATADTALGMRCPELILPLRPVIAAPRNCGYRTRRARIIRSSDLHLANAGRVDGIPVVGVARALLDASVGRDADAVVGLINACQRHSSLAFGALVESLHAHARRGRPGIRVFRAALGQMTAEVPDSEFERLVIGDLIEHGAAEPRLHHVVRLPGEAPIELDVDWPGLLLDVELDGRDHLVRMSTARRDRQRDRLLQRAGYIVARYTWEDYLADRDTMIAEIAAFVDDGGRQRHIRTA